MLQFLLPLLGALGKGGVGGAKGLAGLFQKHPQVASLLTSLSGGLIGAAGQPKTIDPAKLQQLFGAQALGPETTQVLNTLMNSPAVQSAMSQAAEAGQQFSNDIASKSSAASGDSTSGIRAFADSAGRQAPGQFQRGVTSKVAETAAQIAQQNLRDRMAAYVGSEQVAQQMPSWGQILGGNIANAGSQLATMPGPTATPAPVTAQDTATTPKALIGSTADTANASPTGSVMLGPNGYQLRRAHIAMGPSRAVFSNARRGPAAYTF